MRVELKLGDCLDKMKEIPDGSVDLIVTSPPYDKLRTYNGYTFDFEGTAKELVRVLKSGGVIVWVVNDATVSGSETGTSFKQALHFKSLGLNIHDTMIYAKKAPPPLTHNRYEQQFEYMFVLSKSRPKTFNGLQEETKYKGEVRHSHYYKDAAAATTTPGNTAGAVKPTKLKNNIWFYAGANAGTEAKYKHPAKFPLQLALDHIQSWSNPNDSVLDPFLGSGTTGEAAILLNRKFIGIEISEEYFEIAQNRVNAAITLMNTNKVEGVI